MPTYDYECDACGHKFELFQNISEEPQTKCLTCKKKKLRRLFGTGAAIMGTDTYPRPSGTSPASHVTSTDGGTVVFYRSFQGDLDVGTSSRVAPFTRLRTTAGFGGYTQIVGF